MIGIYKITIEDKVYVGQSRKIKSRWNYHKNQLRRKKHGNEKLQAQYDVIGECSFEVLEETSKDMLYEREEYWIRRYDSVDNGLNKVIRNGWNYEYTEEMRRKLSESAKKRGRTCGNLTSEKAKVIRYSMMEGMMIKELVHSFGESRKVIGGIVNMKSYKEPEAIPDGYIEWFEEIKEARARGERPTKRGWKHSEEFKEKFRKAVSKPNYHQRKLSDEQVQEVLDRLVKGERNGHLAKEYNVSPQLISKIKRNNGR